MFIVISKSNSLSLSLSLISFYLIIIDLLKYLKHTIEISEEYLTQDCFRFNFGLIVIEKDVNPCESDVN